MKICLIHLTSLWSTLVGRPGREVADDEARRAGAHAAEQLPGLVAAVSDGCARVVLVLDAPRRETWRAQLDADHAEIADQYRRWPAPAWAPMGEAVAALCLPTVEPIAYDGGVAALCGWAPAIQLAGLRGSARDTIATIAHLWAEALLPIPGEPGPLAPMDSRLRIVSNRSALAGLADPAAGIEVVRHVSRLTAGSWGYTPPVAGAELAAELKCDPRLAADVRALAQVGAWHRAANAGTRAGIGDDGARKLVAAFGSALGAVEAARLCPAGERLPGVGAPAMLALRWAAERGGAEVLRALAIHVPRTDAPVDWDAVWGSEGSDDGREEADRGAADHHEVRAERERGGAARPDLRGGVRAGEAHAGGLGPAARSRLLRERGELELLHVDDEAGAACSTAPGAEPAAPHALAPVATPEACPAPVAAEPQGRATGAAEGREDEDTRGADVAPQTERRERRQETTTVTTQAPRTIEAEIEQPYANEQPPAAAPLAVRPPEPAPMEAHRPRAIDQEPKREQGPQMMSDRTDALFRHLMRAQLEFGEVKKTREVLSRSGAIMYRYANLSDLVEAVMPALKKHGFATTSIARGNRLYVRLVHVDSEQWIEGVLPFVAPTVNGPEGVQALGSLLTYLRRYLLSMLVGVVAVDDDDDGSAAMNAQRRAS